MTGIRRGDSATLRLLPYLQVDDWHWTWTLGYAHVPHAPARLPDFGKVKQPPKFSNTIAHALAVVKLFCKHLPAVYPALSNQRGRHWDQARTAQDLHGCLFLLLCSVLFNMT